MGIVSNVKNALSGAPTKLKFNKTEIDLGESKPGSKKEIVYKINDQRAIQSYSKDCGCTAVQLDNEKVTLVYDVPKVESLTKQSIEEAKKYHDGKYHFEKGARFYDKEGGNIRITFKGYIKV